MPHRRPRALYLENRLDCRVWAYYCELRHALAPGHADLVARVHLQPAPALAKVDEHRVQAAREELLTVMRQRFLRGEEAAFFDYATLCDNNPGLDDLQQEARDAEERYFDED